MKTPALLIAVLLGAAASVSAQSTGSTINSSNKYAYAANLGWVDFRSQLPAGDLLAANGVVIGEYVCSGFAYGANVGWINFGSGVAANLINYQNNSATDFGINHDGTGRLRGFAYGANIGWINFEDLGNPTVNLSTGKLSGFAYSANCGWINLGDITAFVQTDIIRKGVDSDGDGITDAWELLNFGNLTTVNQFTDFDGDGISDLAEYRAGTDPKDRNSGLKIISFDKTALMLTWTSVPNRFYMIETNPDLLSGWTNDPVGTIAGSGGATTTSPVTSAAAKKIYRVRGFPTALLQP